MASRVAVSEEDSVLIINRRSWEKQVNAPEAPSEKLWLTVELRAAAGRDTSTYTDTHTPQ